LLSAPIIIVLGGNAPVIAQRIAKNGGNVVLGAQNAADLPIDGRVVPSGTKNNRNHLTLADKLTNYLSILLSLEAFQGFWAIISYRHFELN
jgi:hypothetical protein